MLAFILLVSIQDSSIEELVGKLSAESVHTREAALDQLCNLSREVLPRLRGIREKEKDRETRSRLTEAIRTIELKDFQTRFGLRGERFVRKTFGPPKGFPVTIESVVPTRVTWLEGVPILLVLRNGGDKPAEITWMWESMQVKGRPVSGKYALDLPDMVLKGRETRVILLMPGSLYLKTEDSPYRVSYDLTAGLRIGDESEMLSAQAMEMPVEVREATTADEEAALQEIRDLGKTPYHPSSRPRFLHLLRLYSAFRSKPSPEDIRLSYERVARDLQLAEALVETWMSLVPEEKALTYARERVRKGEAAPLNRCAIHFGRDMGPAVIRLLDHDEFEIRRRALQSVRVMKLRAAEEKIAAMMDRETDGPYAMNVAVELGLPRPKKLVRFLNSDETWIVSTAMHGLIRLHARDQVDAVRAALKNARATRVRAILIEGLGALGASVDELKPLLKHRKGVIRAAAIRALGFEGTTSSAGIVAPFLDSEEALVSRAAMEALGRLRSAKHVERIDRKLFESHEDAAVACEALGRIGGDEAITVLRNRVPGVSTYGGYVSRLAVEALVRVLPRDRWEREFMTLLENERASWSLQVRLMSRVAPLGPRAAGNLRALLRDESLAPYVMWELSRYSAPEGFKRLSDALPPLAVWDRVGMKSFLNRFGLPIRFDGVDGWESKPPAYFYDWSTRISLRRALIAIVDRWEEPLGFIITDKEIRIVPRAKAVKFYLDLKLD